MALRERRSTQLARHRRATRVRVRIRGSAGRPRLSVFRSLKHFSAQLIDDSRGRTLVFAADGERTIHGSALERARAVGQLIAERATAKGIRHVVFDRGRYRYHGRVRAAAEGARAGGLIF